MRYLPLALVVGWAATEIAASIALMAGLGLSVALILVLWGLVAGAALVLAQFVPARPPMPLRGERARLGRVVAAAGALVPVFALIELGRGVLLVGAVRQRRLVVLAAEGEDHRLLRRPRHSRRRLHELPARRLPAYPASGVVLFNDVTSLRHRHPPPRATQATCTLPRGRHAFCAAILTDFLRRYRL